MAACVQGMAQAGATLIADGRSWQKLLLALDSLLSLSHKPVNPKVM